MKLSKTFWRVGLILVASLTALQIGSCANIPVVGPILQSLANLVPSA